jgi:hypothetical protein
MNAASWSGFRGAELGSSLAGELENYHRFDVDLVFVGIDVCADLDVLIDVILQTFRVEYVPGFSAFVGIGWSL